VALAVRQKEFAKLSAQAFAHEKTAQSAGAPATQAKQHAAARKAGSKAAVRGAQKVDNGDTLVLR
jgi:hypothetical protein